MPYTVTQTARAANVSPSTVRLWAREYNGYLSPGATPDKGTQRLFTEGDIAVFKTVKALRDSNASGEQIIAALDEGERLETLPQQGQDDTGSEKGEPGYSTAILPSELLQAIVTPYRQAIQAHEARIERLENELQAEREARLQAEINAARLEGRLQEGNKKPFNFFDWLLGK